MSQQQTPAAPKPSADGLPPVVGTATATAELMIRTTSGSNFEVVTNVPAGTFLQLTGVTENGRTQVIWEGKLRWVNSLYLSDSASVSKPPSSTLPTIVGTKYATTALILRSSPNDDYVSYGDAPAGSALDVTGREINGRAQIVYNGAVRWVTAHYLSDSPPASDKINLPGLTTNAQRLLEAVQARFPEIKTIYGVRQDPLPDHPSGRALDIMVYTNSGQGEAVADWAQANARSLNIEYIIWNQRIWSVARSGEGWRYMADRGSNTANHKDHVHITVQ